MVKINKIEALLNEKSALIAEMFTRLNSNDDLIESLNALPEKIDKISSTLNE